MPANTPESIEQLRRNIARRKRSDRAFYVAGAVLIFGALGVLALLFMNLLIEGAPALTQTFQTQPNATGTGMDDYNGTIKPGPDGTWLLKMAPMPVEGVTDNEATNALLGKRVGVKGKIPGGLDPTARVSSLTAPDATPVPDFTGTLTRRDGQFVFDPDPIRTTILPDVPVDQKALLKEGATVVLKRKSHIRRGQLEARSVERLISEPPHTKTFFTSFPSKEPSEAGILSAWVGTLLTVIITVLAAVPMGVAAGMYLEEYAPKNRLTSIIEINIANLAGVPSIIWGLLALSLFVYGFHFGRSILTAGLTLGLLVLPIVIITTREAIRAIPNTIREASIGLGATKWQTVRYHILPYSLPGILTGSIIALSRAIGETAPLVTIGALTFIAFLPEGVSESAPYVEPGFFSFQWVWSEFTVLPIQLFQWVSRPQVEFHRNAAAAGVVLLAMTLSLNGVAIFLRYRLRRNIKW